MRMEFECSECGQPVKFEMLQLGNEIKYRIKPCVSPWCTYTNCDDDCGTCEHYKPQSDITEKEKQDGSKPKPKGTGEETQETLHRDQKLL